MLQHRVCCACCAYLPMLLLLPLVAVLCYIWPGVCRQYLNEEQVWSGLVVEVTQRLEEKLGSKQRRLMRYWWVVSPWAWLCLLLTPMRLLAGMAYNWKTRRLQLLLRCLLPLLLVLAVVAVCMGVGIRELQVQAHEAMLANGTTNSPANSTANGTANGTAAGAMLSQDKLPVSTTCNKKTTAIAIGRHCSMLTLPLLHTCFMLQVNKSAVAAVAAAGVLTGLLAAVVAAATNCKQISDTLVEGRTHLHFKDHSDKIGYQHAVRVSHWCMQSLLSCIFNHVVCEALHL